MKIRLETMSKCHCGAFIAACVIIMVIIFGASFEAPDMLTYNLGDSQTCGHEYSLFWSPSKEVEEAMN